MKNNKLDFEEIEKLEKANQNFLENIKSGKWRVGEVDKTPYRKKLGADGVWRITKHSESYINQLKLANQYVKPQ